MNAIKSIGYEGCDDPIQDQDTLELSEAAHPLLIAFVHQLREIKGIHNRLDVQNKQVSKLHKLAYLCEHNLIFFLMQTGQYNALHDLFHPKRRLGRSKSLLYKIKKRRARRRHAAANQKEYSFAPKLIHTNKELTMHYEEILQDQPRTVQPRPFQGTRYSFFRKNPEGLSFFSELTYRP